MMKRIALATIAAVAFSATAMAQDVKLGIRGGLNLADLKYEPKDQTNGTPNANSLASFNAGLIVDIPVVSGLSIQTGAGVTGKGSKVEWTNGSGTYTQTINPLYLEIPANIVFKPQIAPGTRLYFGAGPYLGIGIGGKAAFTGNTPIGNFYSDHALKYGNDNNSDLKPTDAGANILAGFEFGQGLTLGAQYGLSFTNNAPNGNNNAPKILRNKVFSINAGFFFK
ncbi:MAG TPA: porin family protein [Chitinophagaceae bacterium]